ncbi:MAG: hypothetical protein ACKVWR_10075 [Acidimicrobiales bacterium]
MGRRPRRAAVAAALPFWVGLVLADAPPAAAHGIGSRADLPLPRWLFVYGAGAGVVVSFAALRLLWTRPRLARAAEGRALPGPVSAAARLLAGGGRALGVAAWALTLAAAWFGAADSSANIAPVAVYVVFWVGVALASALLGDLWRVLNPFDTLAALAGAVKARRWPGPAPEPPHHWTLYPAAAGIAAFAWLELAYHEPASPRVLALALTLYSTLMLAGAVRRGRAWLRVGDGFAALFSLLGLLGPFFRGRSGELRVRWPLAGLAADPPRRGVAALVLVTLGSTTFDGVSRTQAWGRILGDSTGWAATARTTIGLALTVAAVAGAYYAACWAVAARAERAGYDAVDAAAEYAHGLVPIALAYAVAHYFSLLVFEGQRAWSLASDPFGEGWDLFGAAGRAVEYGVIGAVGIAYVQAGAVVAGHVGGVLASHDRAVETLPAREAARTQVPMLVVMVAYTVVGLGLLLGA